MLIIRGSTQKTVSSTFSKCCLGSPAAESPGILIKRQIPELLSTFTDIQVWSLSYCISKRLFTTKQEMASKRVLSSLLDPTFCLKKQHLPLKFSFLQWVLNVIKPEVYKASKIYIVWPIEIIMGQVLFKVLIYILTHWILTTILCCWYY